MTLRRSRIDAAARVAERTGLGALLRLVPAWRGALVLNYHRVGYDSELRGQRCEASPEAFDAQIEFLKRNFDVVTARDLETLARRRRGRAVLVTFDDGYRDVHQHAYPILRRHGIEATTFVTTGFLDRTAVPWWDELAWMVARSRATTLPPNRWLARPLPLRGDEAPRALEVLLARYKQLPGGETEGFLDAVGAVTGGRPDPDSLQDEWLTWDMVREMHRAGMCFGGHTVSHPVLARHSIARQGDEIFGCASRLEAELGEPMRYFSYPVGLRDSFDVGTRAVLAGAGVRLAFSFYGGYRDFENWDPLDVRRLGVSPRRDVERFKLAATLPGIFPTW